MGTEYCPADWPNAMRSLIHGRDAACIGKTYCAISQTSGQMIQQKLIAAIALSVLLVAGCGKNPASSAAHSNKMRVGDIVLMFEAPIDVDYEKVCCRKEG